MITCIWIGIWLVGAAAIAALFSAARALQRIGEFAEQKEESSVGGCLTVLSQTVDEIARRLARFEDDMDERSGAILRTHIGEVSNRVAELERKRDRTRPLRSNIDDLHCALWRLALTVSTDPKEEFGLAPPASA